MHLVSRQVDLGLTGDLLWLCTHKAPLSDFAHHLPLTIHPFRGLDTDKSIDKWKKDLLQPKSIAICYTKFHSQLLASCLAECWFWSLLDPIDAVSAATPATAAALLPLWTPPPYNASPSPA